MDLSQWPMVEEVRRIADESYSIVHLTMAQYTQLFKELEEADHELWMENNRRMYYGLDPYIPSSSNELKVIVIETERGIRMELEKERLWPIITRAIWDECDANPHCFNMTERP